MRHISPDFVIAIVVLAAAVALHNRLVIIAGAGGMTFAALRMMASYLSTPNS